MMVIIYAYDESSQRDLLKQMGFAMVIGFAATVTLGYPAQLMKLLPKPEECLIKTKACLDAVGLVSETINIWLVCIWAVCTLFVLACESERGRHPHARHQT